MKEKMLGYKQKGKQQTNKKIKIDKAKTVDQKSNKGKRKSDNTSEEVKVKRKKDDNMDVDESEKDGDSGVKRPHDDNDHGTYSSNL